MLGCPIGASSNAGDPASHPAPYLWPGKAMEDSPKPWDPASVEEARKKFLVPGFGLAQLRPLQPVGGKSSDGMSLFHCVYLPCN